MVILSELFNTLLYVPILNFLIFLYWHLWENLGIAIIAMTIILRFVLYPLTKPSMEMARKQKELQPELDKLKKEYKNKQVLAQKQMELYKKHGANPASGCLPQIVQLIIVIALYKVFTNLLSGLFDAAKINPLLYFDSLKLPLGYQLNTHFLYLNLSKPDPYYVLPVLAAVSQFFMSKYMMVGSKKNEKLVEGTPDKKDDIMYNMQNQMMYLLPVMTLIIGIKLPSGLVLYWFVSTMLAIAMYYYVNKRNEKKDVQKRLAEQS